MFKLYLKEFLKARGYEGKTSELIRIGLSRHHARQLLGEKTSAIRLDDLALLCRHFKCTIDELFNFVPLERDHIESDHPLWKLKKEPVKYSPIEYLRLVKPGDVNEVNNYLRNKAGI